MPKPLINFGLTLALALALAFAGHLALLSARDMPLMDDMILLSYSVNYFLALFIFLLLFLLRKRMKNQLGFLFMAGSLFKFLVFFLVFYPPFLADGDIARSEFASFFVPYAVALVVETVGVSRMLQASENGES